ncbi:MAG: LPS-assembly protein LptD, partial [Thiohalomonadales bacterium]
EYLLNADSLEYDNTKDYLFADGNIFFSTKTIEVRGTSIELDVQNNQGEVKNTQYYIFDNGARGTSPSVKIESKNKIKFIKPTYTTCPVNNSAWKIKAGEIELNNETHQGTAKNAVLSIQNIPVFYFPYFRFPFRTNRLSGFLAPSWGTSNNNGNQYRVPFYWNIAPNYDATIAPRHMTKRGTLIDTEFRYLTRNNFGKIDIEFIQNDAKFNDDRQYYAIKNSYTNGRNWSSTVDLQYYSDTQYLSDFSIVLEEASATHVESFAEIVYSSTDWLFKTKVQGYQTLSGDDPYTRLPQILFNYKDVPLDNQLNYFFRSEFVYFDHTSKEPRDGRTTTPTGLRSDLETAISYPLKNSAAYLKPKLSLRYTQYNLNNPGRDADDPSIEYESNPYRFFPTFSFDSGVFFERDTSFVNIPILNTLEPRIFYLYRPERDQSQLPNFDTTAVDKSFKQLFRTDTTTGADEIPSANELSLGLSTHYYRLDSGVSMISASLGQKFFFKSTTEPTDTTNYFVDISAQPSSAWSLGTTMEYNKKTKDLDKSTSRLQYKTWNFGVINFLHRYERFETESIDISLQWKITAKWQAFGRRNYDRFNHKMVEEVYGLRYDNCCWAFRMMNRQTVIENERSVFFEFILKGITSIGDKNKIDPLINNAIIDFSN